MNPDLHLQGYRKKGLILSIRENFYEKYRRAIVTGGAGFIGSHIVEALLNLEVQVICVDDYSAGKEKNIASFQGHPKFIEAKCDITDYNALKKYFEGVDIVFHNAASKKTVCLKDPRRDLEVNAKGMFNLLELSREFGVGKFMHASTGSVYGEAIYYPQDEKHPLAPRSYYGVSKLAAEKYAMVFSQMYDLNVTILRYFHVYGPKQDYSDAGGVVSIFGKNILSGIPPVIYGDGTQERSFTYVSDVVAINIFAATLDNTNGEVYNCASGIRVTINQLADKIKNILGRSDLDVVYGDWAPGDIKKFIVDNSKLKSLGFEFKISFEDGLKRTLNWLEKQLS